MEFILYKLVVLMLFLLKKKRKKKRKKYLQHLKPVIYTLERSLCI